MNTYTSERVEILDGTVMIDGLRVTEEAVVGLVAAEPDEDRPELVRRLLALGAQGAVTMGVGFDVDRVRETLTETAGRATGDVGRALAAGARRRPYRIATVPRPESDRLSHRGGDWPCRRRAQKHRFPARPR